MKSKCLLIGFFIWELGVSMLWEKLLGLKWKQLKGVIIKQSCSRGLNYCKL